jgi:hypothetical protein
VRKNQERNFRVYAREEIMGKLYLLGNLLCSSTLLCTAELLLLLGALYEHFLPSIQFFLFLLLDLPL